MSVTSSLDASSSCLSTAAADPTTSKPATEKVKLTKRQSHFLRFITWVKLFEVIKIMSTFCSKVMDVRLPSHLKPLHYRVSLVPFIIPNNFTIKGSVMITFEATLDGANNITVHTAETNITHDSGNVINVDMPQLKWYIKLFFKFSKTKI